MPNRVPTFRPKRIGATSPNPARHRRYDRTRRDPEAKSFYNTDAWKRIRLMKLNESPLCEECRKHDRLVPASVVHHAVELRADWSRSLDLENLASLCASCHSRLHAGGNRA
jgi:5-methylcytosine-specific restriction protein A